MRYPHRAGNRDHTNGAGALRRSLCATDTASAVFPEPSTMDPAKVAIHGGPGASCSPARMSAARGPTDMATPLARHQGTAELGSAVPGLAISPLLSAAEVGAIFNRGARTIRRWIRAGHLRPVRIGSALFFRADEVRRLVHSDVVASVMTSSLPRGRS